jgi:hypothetical protein
VPSLSTNFNLIVIVSDVLAWLISLHEGHSQNKVQGWRIWRPYRRQRVVGCTC